jgi:hypothetical protein
MASDYTASHLAISAVNCVMNFLRRSGKAYAAQLTASGVKVKLIEEGQHGSLNLPLTLQGAQSQNLIVGSPNSRSIGAGHLRYESDSYIAHYRFILTFCGAGDGPSGYTIVLRFFLAIARLEVCFVPCRPAFTWPFVSSLDLYLDR